MPGKLIYLLGPSGAGKDSLIAAAREALHEIGCEVAQRVITRWPASTRQTPHAAPRFQTPVQIDEWLAAGRHVLVNGSRGHLQQARERYPELIPILLTVTNEVLRRRLIRRGRESGEEIERRMQRNAVFADEGWGDDQKIVHLDNSGELSVTVMHLLRLLQQQGISAVQDRT